MQVELPPQPTDPYKETCGICETQKTIEGGWMFCDHCDQGCAKRTLFGPSNGCGICQAGMKGLPDRGDL